MTTAPFHVGMVLDNEFTGDMRVENEVISLTRAGFRVTVLCFNYGSKPATERYHGADIVRLPVNREFIKKTKALVNAPVDVFTWYMARKITAFVHEHRPAALHVHDLPMLPAALRANRQLATPLPLVADLHENYPAALQNYRFANTFPGKYLISIPKWRRKEIEWVSAADHVITVIEEATNRYDRLGVPPEKLTVVANYVNREEFADGAVLQPEITDRYAGEFVLSYVGGFDRHRGLEDVIRATPELAVRIPNLRVVLVGAGSNLGELKQLAAELDVAGYVDFAGWQAPAVLPSYLAASAVCLIPHVKSEHTDNTIPHKLFQYMYLQKPVVAANCDPLVRILDDTGAGLTYPSGDAAALARRVIRLHDDRPLMQQMGARGKQAVIDTYNWEATATELTDLYRRIAASPAR